MRTETLKLGHGVYTIPEVASILRIPKRKVDHWVNAYLKYRFKEQQGHQYNVDLGRQSVLNFHALVETYTFFALKAGGVPIKKIIEAHDMLSKRYNTVYPFAHASVMRSGGDVLFSEISKHGADDLVKADKSLQLYLHGVIQPFCENLRFNEWLMADRFYPLGKDKKVVVDPNHQFGQPTIEGTNILASTVYDLYSAGESKRLIKNLYDLNDRQVNDAIAYFSQAA